MKDRVFHLILIVVAGVILADLVSNTAGTSALVKGFGTLFTIGTQPTNTTAIGKIMGSTSVAKNNSASKAV